MKIKLLLCIGTIAFSILSKLSAQTEPVKPVYDSVLDWQWKVVTDLPRWDLVEKTNRFIYDADKNCLRSISQWFSLLSNAWEDYKIKTYTYDSNGNMLTDATLLKPDSVWQNNVKYIYTYNSQHKVLTHVEQNGTNPNDTSVWTNRMRNSYSYDSNGNQLTDLWEYNVSGVWEKNRLFTKTYDAGNHITLVLDKSWINNNWADTSKTTYTYDSNGNLLVQEESDKKGSTWTIKSRTTNTYDSNNDKINVVLQTAGGTNSDKLDYTYNNKHQIITEVRKKWDPKTGNWIDYSKSDSYEYDVFGNLTEMILYHLEKGNYWKFSRPAYNYNSDNLMYSTAQRRYNLAGALAAGDSTHYYFHDFTTGILSGKKNTGDVLVYPNPTKDSFTIKLLNNEPIKQIEILNSLGQQVILQSNVNTINLSGLPKGMYFLKIADWSEIYVRKIMLE